ncbi:DegV family protein [Tepidibacter formicigenes]|uniref:EDD domain protein, DegV family n=1 Tax=Tepidibacter formicigenes DSM 15518 TaxID=1123349 RepID=A0A1M6LBL8_9FIRM|nr:DegV family protein [Tepidibacter formicigenes]SHJ68568.1 EDD domain protein, DegV family [Tepidibacter formicigenes DSM 15518]
MNNIKLITDSSCDLPEHIIKEYNISIIPLNILFRNESYLDGVDISKKEFYKKIKNYDKLPKTSSPSPLSFFKEYDCEEENVLVISLSSGLSSTYNNALIGKNMYLEEYKGKRIEVLDSKTGSMGLGLCVLKAAKLIKEGKNIDYIIRKIKEDIENSFTYVVLDTVENAVKAGRISSFKEKIVQILNLKIIVKVEDGLVKVFDRARGDKKSLNKLIDYIESAGVNTSERILAICHANALNKALKLQDLVNKKYEFKEIIISEIGASIGSYSSEGAILISF